MSQDPTGRAAALRAAVRSVVAERGLHGASMTQIAAAAGVAAGTAYVHYSNKDDLVLAAYVEAKHALGQAAVTAAAAVDTDDPRDRLVALWLGVHRHLRAHPADARFVLQVDASPHAPAAHARVLADGDDPLVAEVSASGVRDGLLDLDDQLLYELALAPAVRLAAHPAALSEATLETVAGACVDAVIVR